MPHLKLTKVEEAILTAIVALSLQLSRPLDTYYGILARIREQKFGIRGCSRGEVTKGYIEAHQPKAWSGRYPEKKEDNDG